MDETNISSRLNLSLIRVSGPDAAKFLQGQITCDVREITPQHSGLGAYCNHKGRVLAIFRIFVHENNYYLLLTKSILETTLTTFKKYAIFSNVSLDVSDDFTALSSDPIFAIISKCKAENSWRLYNIEAGIPTIYLETIEKFTPHMLNLPELSAISFNKGCYLGQEVIARTEYLGKTKRHTNKIEIACTLPPAPGNVIKEADQELGTVIDSAIINQNKCSALVIS